MTKHIACTDIVHGCAFEASAKSEEELLRQVTAHAKESHGIAQVMAAADLVIHRHLRVQVRIPQVTPDLAEKVKAAIRER